MPPLNSPAMYMTPDHVKETLRREGYGAIRKAIRASYWELYRLGYNRKAIQNTLAKEFGTEDTYIRREINLQTLQIA